jgi:hypothetical protein
MVKIPLGGEAESLFRLGFDAMGLDGRFGQQDDEMMIASVVYNLDQGVTRPVLTAGPRSWSARC